MIQAAAVAQEVEDITLADLRHAVDGFVRMIDILKDLEDKKKAGVLNEDEDVSHVV